MDDKTTLDLSASIPAHIAAANDPETVLPPPQETTPSAEEVSKQNQSARDASGAHEIQPEMLYLLEGMQQVRRELPAAVAQIQDGMLHLLEGMQQVRRDFDTKVKYDESKERQIMVLHEELQHRDNFHFQTLRPILVDLIALYDDISRMLEDNKKRAEAFANQWVENFQSIQETIEEILRQNGAEAFTVAGIGVNPERQRILRVIDTDDPTLDKQVAKRLRKGFLYDTKVLRPEWVEVYRYLAKNEG